jgi:MurNAc alpha-1-phosphate uridylyltransferase
MSKVDAALIVSTEQAALAGPIFGPQPTALAAVQGRALVDRILDRLEDHAIKRVAIDAGGSKAQLAQHLARAPRATVVDLADGGGPVGPLIAALGPGPFFVINADAFWFDGYRPALMRLERAWSDADMDALVLLFLTPRAVAYAGMGDFALDPFGRARRRPEREVVPYAHTGVQLVHPRLFRDPRKPIAALPSLLAEAEAAGRLGGVVHDGLWFRLTSEADLEDLEERFRRGEVQYGPG